MKLYLGLSERQEWTGLKGDLFQQDLRHLDW